mgnify:CR=1 FL=1
MIDDMKKILLFMLPLVAVCFASCEKDNDNDGNSVQKLIKEISWIEDGYSVVRTYEYDSQNRIIKLIETWDEGETEMSESTVEYEGNTITESFKWKEGANGVWSNDVITKYYLDNDGYVIKCEYIENGEVYSSETYEYENGYLKTARRSVTEEYEWQNGDIVRDSNRKIQYLENEDKMNIDFLNYSAYISGAGVKFQGTCSKHLMSGYGSDSQWNNRTYEFDADGYPTKIRDIDESRTMEYNIKYY